MRYLGYRDRDHGDDAIAIVADDGVHRLTSIDEFYTEPRAWLERAPSEQAIPVDGLHRVPPVPRTAKVLCLGLNYQAHIDETGRDRPPAPNIFARWYSSLSSHGDEVRVPSGEPGLDWECELAIIIGDALIDTPTETAMAGVLGYTCFNDISGRTHQRATPQWALGKNVDGSAPIGPVVVTSEELGDPYGLRIMTRVNGETMQSSTTDHMIFKIDETIDYITRCISLRPGDVIATGTPSGVGSQMDPPRFMHPGDTVEVEIESIGVLSSSIV